MAINRFLEAGYEFIGLDHFAKPDEELAQARRDGSLRRTFQGMTTGKELDVIGLGPSAISQLDGAYAQNHKTSAEWQIGRRGGLRHGTRPEALRRRPPAARVDAAALRPRRSSTNACWNSGLASPLTIILWTRLKRLHDLVRRRPGRGRRGNGAADGAAGPAAGARGGRGLRPLSAARGLPRRTGTADVVEGRMSRKQRGEPDVIPRWTFPEGAAYPASCPPDNSRSLSSACAMSGPPATAVRGALLLRPPGPAA